MPSKRDKRKRQTQLALSPLPSSSPAAKDYHEQIQGRAAAVRYDHSPVPAKRRKTDADTHMQAPLATPVSTSQRQHNDHIENEIHLRSKPQSDLDVLSYKRQQRLDAHVVPSSSLVMDRTSGPDFFDKAHRVSSSSSESDDEPQSSNMRNKRRKIKSHNGFLSSGTVGGVQIRPQTPVSDSEDDMPTTLGSVRSRRQMPPSSPLQSSPPVNISSDEDEVISTQRRRSRVVQPDSEEIEEQQVEDEESDSAPLVSPQRRGLKKRTELTAEEKGDLDSDLDFLDHTSETELNSPRKPRSSQSAQKTARARALEELRRKRSGQPTLPVDEQDDDDAVDKDSDSMDDDPLTSLPTSSSRAMFQADEEDEDFLDDEEADEEAVGVPDIPIEFTRYASMKAKDLFKHAIEWMVQKKLNPAFREQDELYDLAFKKLNDEVSGLVNSKFKSSAWTPDFMQSLTNRPDMQVNDMAGDFFFEHCEACNRKGHPASYEVMFRGRPYHPESLDTVEGDDDSGEDSSSSEDESNADRPAYDYRGNKVPPANKVYHIGRFCMANAETAHELQHWKKSLYVWVVTWLRTNGHLKASKIVKREGWSTKKRRKKANKIADDMNETGVVKQLWSEFSNTIKRAREEKQTYR